MRPVAVLCSMVMSLVWAGSQAAGPATFSAMSGHYEAMRQALLYDGIDGVDDHAGEIAKLAAAAIDEEAGDEVMPEIRRAASRLQTAGSLDEAREAFGELSEALVKFRQEIDGPKPVVAYCSMAQKVWLQPKGEIGNPYYGQSMAECGEIVSE